MYDALNRLTQKNYPDSTSADYTYDLVGKILQVNDPTGTYAFAYDGAPSARFSQRAGVGTTWGG